MEWNDQFDISKYQVLTYVSNENEDFFCSTQARFPRSRSVLSPSLSLYSSFNPPQFHVYLCLRLFQNQSSV
jgi:hypothetical protein